MTLLPPAGTRNGTAGGKSVIEAVRIGHGYTVGGKVVHYFLVVQSHGHDVMDFFFDQGQDLAVIIAFVLAAEYEHRGRGHGYQRIICRIDVGGLGVVDVMHAIDGGNVFQTVLDGRKSA